MFLHIYEHNESCRKEGKDVLNLYKTKSYVVPFKSDWKS